MEQIFKQRLCEEDIYIGLKYQWQDDYTGEFSQIEVINNEEYLNDMRRYLIEGVVDCFWSGIK